MSTSTRRHTDADLRRYMQDSSKTVRELAAELGVAESTIRRWRQRNDVSDRPRVAQRLRTTLSRNDEWWVITLRRVLNLPLDELLLLTRQTINGDASRSGLDRCLRRYGVNPLGRHSPFTHRRLGYFDWWQAALPGCDQALFIAVEQQSRWIHAEIRSQHPRSRSGFISRLQRRAPVHLLQCQRHDDLPAISGDSLTSTGVARWRQQLARLVWLYNHRLGQNQLAGLTPHDYLRQLHNLQPTAFRAQPIKARAPEPINRSVKISAEELELEPA